MTRRLHAGADRAVPTVLTGVRPRIPELDEELVGPVAAIVPAIGEEEGIAIGEQCQVPIRVAVLPPMPRMGGCGAAA